MKGRANRLYAGAAAAHRFHYLIGPDAEAGTHDGTTVDAIPSRSASNGCKPPAPVGMRGIQLFCRPAARYGDRSGGKIERAHQPIAGKVSEAMVTSGNVTIGKDIALSVST